jgi:hypothetical protein
MRDDWKQGEPLSAAKLNRSSAATAFVDYNGSGSLMRSGKNWVIGEPQSASVESFWVSVDKEYETTFTNGGDSRTIYKYDWTEVQFNRAYGVWTKTGRSGNADDDPLMSYDPTIQIPLSTVEPYVFSAEKIVSGVLSVVRDPLTGQLFFF